jgi:hypothetical protein
VHAVVGLLAVDLRREAGDLRVVRFLQARQPLGVGLLVQDMPSDRLLPGEQAQLDEPGTPVFSGCTVERELVCRRAALARDQLVERARMADLVLRDRRERHVLLQQGRDPRPLRVAPAEDQLVVSDLQQELLFLLVHVPP